LLELVSNFGKPVQAVASLSLLHWLPKPTRRAMEQWFTSQDCESGNAPEAEIVEQLRLHLQQSTEIADPALLLRRNAEMIASLTKHGYVPKRN